MKFTPEQFGAIGNGTIDDTPALHSPRQSLLYTGAH
jgi:hypothetical protein